jgi:hypothetical protein
VEQLKEIVDNTIAPSHDFSLEVQDVFEVNRGDERARFWPFNKLEN